MSFLESPRLPLAVSFGAQFGPDYDVTINVTASGTEQRNINRGGVGLIEGKLTETTLTAAQHAELLSFVRALKGQGHGFRARDPMDYVVTTADGVLIAATGTPGTYKFVRRYTAGALSDDRIITKPVTSTLALYRNAVLATAGAGAGQYALTNVVGIGYRVVFVPNSTKAITGITKANPGVLTVVAHGFLAGALVGVSGVAGMTQINGLSGTVTVVDADHISLGIDTTSYGTYTSGGTASRYGDTTDALTWSGEFDIAVRFSGKPKATIVARSGANLILEWEDAGIVEIPNP